MKMQVCSKIYTADRIYMSLLVKDIDLLYKIHRYCEKAIKQSDSTRSKHGKLTASLLASRRQSHNGDKSSL